MIKALKPKSLKGVKDYRFRFIKALSQPSCIIRHQCNTICIRISFINVKNNVGNPRFRWLAFPFWSLEKPKNRITTHSLMAYGSYATAPPICGDPFQCLQSPPRLVISLVYFSFFVAVGNIYNFAFTFCWLFRFVYIVCVVFCHCNNEPPTTNTTHPRTPNTHTHTQSDSNKCKYSRIRQIANSVST